MPKIKPPLKGKNKNKIFINENARPDDETWNDIW